MTTATAYQQNIHGEKLADLILATACRYRLTIHEAGKAVEVAILNNTDRWTEADRSGVIAEVAMAVATLDA